MNPETYLFRDPEVSLPLGEVDLRYSIFDQIDTLWRFNNHDYHVKLSPIPAGCSHSAGNNALWGAGWGLLLDLCFPHGCRQESNTGNFVQFDKFTSFLCFLQLYYTQPCLKHCVCVFYSSVDG